MFGRKSMSYNNDEWRRKGVVGRCKAAGNDGECVIDSNIHEQHIALAAPFKRNQKTALIVLYLFDI
jgi:hypothetical protein